MNENGKKEEKKHREKLFSEAHPQAYKVASTILPRIHTLLILFALLYFMMNELVKGNTDFLIDWYHESWILPSMVEILSSPENFQNWFQTYGTVFIMFMITLIIAGFVFYRTVWRFLFKDYVKESEMVTTYEGRCYFRTNGFWCRLWDALYKSPPRKKIKCWIKPNKWPPLNIFNPVKSLIKIELSPDEEIEEYSMFELHVHEKPFRRIKDIDEYETHDEGYLSGEIPLEYAGQEFGSRTIHLISDTQRLSLANPSVRLMQLRDGSYIAPPELKEAARIAKERRGD